MLCVTGTDWFCMCERAGPEAPAMGDSTETQNMCDAWLCLQTSPGFPRFGFCNMFLLSALTYK